MNQFLAHAHKKVTHNINELNANIQSNANISANADEHLRVTKEHLLANHTF